MSENIIQKIINNKDNITGITIDGTFYDVSFIGVDGQDCYDQMAPTDTIVSAYQVDEFDCVLKYDFTVEFIKNAKEVKLYRFEEII